MKNVLKKFTAAVFAMLFASNLYAADNNLSNKILFVEKEKAGSTYLSVMDPNGANKKRLTPSMFNIVFPKYNNKSGWVAFTNQTANMSSEIYILNKNGDQLKKILTNASFEDFSPDGKSFLYITTDQNASLYVFNIAKKEATKVSQTLKVTSANWSPDGEWIVASVLTDDGTLDLYLISCYAQGIIRATETPNVNEAFPMFSNDNLKVAFYTNRHGDKNEIEILGVGVKNNLALTRPLLVGTHPSFSPDDKSIVYQDGEDIYVSDLNGHEPTKIGTGRTPYWTK
ncbi:MAG: PD40 domain-containing protein [Candidatus Riflebacteria bacterium]|nr:PD40 domain-containing protein [Candidatus Riflebacteria bacterium]